MNILGATLCFDFPSQGRHLRGLGGRRPKEKKEKRKKKEKGKKINKRTMNNVKELHIKYCFFSIFQWH